MQLQKLPNGSIRLSRLSPWDVGTFRSLPSLADYSADSKAEKRLLPSPAIESDLSPEMAMDWVEYVIPDLRESFAENLAVVMGDLDGLTPEPAGDFDAAEEDGPLETPDDSGDPDIAESDESAGRSKSGSNASPDSDQSPDLDEKPAFSAPGYSTLTIPADHAEAWFLAMNQARIVLSARYGIDSENVPELSKLLEAGHIEYWFQYELFVSLQGWLVEAVMDPE